MPRNNPNKKSLEEGMPPPTPPLGTRIMAFVILGLIVTSPLLWMFGSGPLFRAVSPLVCPDGSKLTTRSEYVAYDPGSGQNNTTFINFDCVDPSGYSVDNHADIILFSVCAGPFIWLLLWGFISTFLRKNKIKLEVPFRRRRS
jgi:hypothetical protein